jgi:drug/metabolite transporter (DMT)-like permease
MSSYIIAISLALCASVSWGLNSFVLKSGATDDGPMLALVIRAVIAFPILLLITLLTQSPDALWVYFRPQTFLLGLILVITIVFGDGIFIYSLRDYSVNLILPIASIYPLITTLILLVTGEETVTALVIFGTLLVVVGIAIVTSKGTFIEGFPIKGLFLGLGVALGWGSSVVVAKIILDQSDTSSFGLMTFRTIFIGLFALVFLILSAGERENLRNKSRKSINRSIKIFGLSGILGWVLGASLLFLAIELIGAAVPTPISSKNPIIAVIIGYGTGIERINKYQMSGILISTLGVILILI